MNEETRQAEIVDADAQRPRKAAKMNNVSQSTLEAKEQIQVLLAEYATLRNEVAHRTNNIFQLYPVGAAIFTFIMGQKLDWLFGIALLASALIIGVSTIIAQRDVQIAASRIREIELMVNSLAGEKFLEWETRWGSSSTGMLFRKRPPQSEIVKRFIAQTESPQSPPSGS